MGWFSKNKEYLKMDVKPISWIELTSIGQLQDLLMEKDKIYVIFKHSTRCSISKMVLNRFQKEWNINDNNVFPLFLDLLSHRDISNFIAEELEVQHESPQILIVKNEISFYDVSHTAISFLKVEKLLRELK
jgi:bacillithiol system protein YtxJ